MKIEFIPALPLSHPPVPGLHPPDEPGAFLFQDIALLNQTREPHSDNPVYQALAASLAYCAIVVLIHASLSETTSFSALCSKVGGWTQAYRPAGSLRIGYAR